MKKLNQVNENELQDEFSEMTKNEILNSARRIFAKSDVADVSIEKIADDAGIAVGTIYNYFTDLDDLKNSAASAQGSTVKRETFQRTTIKEVREVIREVIQTSKK
jgi:AcrR family transcriptional regulator